MSFYYLPIDTQIMEVRQLIIKADASIKKKLPGSLIIHKKYNQPQFYQKIHDKRIYIPKSDQHLIHALAQKSYDERFLKEARSLLDELDHLQLAHAERSASDMYYRLSNIYNKLPSFRKDLVTPYVLPDDLYIQEWLSESYEGLPFTDSDPLIMTERGERVRSKSEKIIADKLYALGLPYRYEFPVYIPGFGLIHPDFTILDIMERREVYLEHFGLMQDPDYSVRAFTKIDRYRSAGYHLGDNFLCTFEGGRYVFQTQPFTVMMKERFRIE